MLSFYRALKILFRLLPDAVRYPLARGIAHAVLRANRARRTMLESNLTPLVGPARAQALAPRVLGSFLTTSIDFFCPRSNLVRDLAAENARFFQDAHRRYGRLMFATAHLGHWELGLSAVAESGLPTTGVYAVYREKPFVDWIMSHRHPGIAWLPAEPGTMAACIHALRSGRVLGMVADLPFGEKGRLVEMFGARTRMPLGPWVIAARARAAVIPSFVLRQSPGRYRIVFHEPIVPDARPLRDSVNAMQDRFAAHLAHYLKTVPEQWGVLEPYWQWG